MKIKSNKGSSLMLVVVLFAVIITLGGSALVVLNTNYKVRVKEGKRLENLYKSEAGLDVAYNVLVKNFEQAIKSGNDIIDSIDPNILANFKTAKEKGEYINKKFQDGFKQVMSVDEIKKSIDEHKYIKNYKALSNEGKYQVVKFNTKIAPTLQCKSIEFKDNKYEAIVVSTFESDKNTSSTGKNLRQVQVTYEIKIPDYEDAIVVEPSEDISYPAELKDKVIAVDKNMNVKSNSGLRMDIKGDVFVKGENNDDSSDYNRVYDKYKGGIKLDTNASTHIILDGNIITANTFNIANTVGDIDTVINGNIYAGNIYVGAENGKQSNNNITNVNQDVVIDNDLAMNGSNSKITINKFFGINDRSYEEEFSKENKFKANTKSSSSIIVNGNKNSSITVQNAAYIMGTAYINAQNNEGKSYKTGESVAIKGNYIAYTKPLKEFNDYDFSLYGPLQMVDSKDGNPLTVSQKSEYFETFIKDNPNNDEISDGSVYLPVNNTHAIGSIVYKNGKDLVVERANYTEAMENVIDQKREEYARQVYSMGKVDEGKNPLDIYNELGKYQKTVKSVVNFDSIKNNYTSSDLVINKDANKTVVITDDIQYKGGKDDIVVKVGLNQDTDMLVLTNGDVKVNSRLIRIKGAIISTGNINFDEWGGSGTFTIKYDDNVINNIIAKHSDKFKGVFSLKQSPSVKLIKKDKMNATIQKHNYKYDIQKYIISKDWKILR